MKIAFFSTKPYDRTYFDRFNSDFGYQLTYYEAGLNDQTAALAAGHDVACVFVNDRVDADVIGQLAEGGVGLIATRSAGFNHIDLAAAGASGLPVVRVPAYSPYAVAEHAVALILALNRKIHRAYNRVRDLNFSLNSLEGFDLYGKTVGVVGTGKIGAIFARIMQGFGCRVLAYDPFESDELKKAGIAYTDLARLLSEADIISLHCPLTRDTYHIIDAAAIKLFKPTVMLVNTSRGGLVDTPAVIKGLKKGKIGALAIDVYEQEEALFFEDLSGQILQDDDISRLMTFPNVLITAHQSFFTVEALEEIARTTLQNISNFAAGKLSNAVPTPDDQ